MFLPNRWAKRRLPLLTSLSSAIAIAAMILAFSPVGDAAAGQKVYGKRSVSGVSGHRNRHRSFSNHFRHAPVRATSRSGRRSGVYLGYSNAGRTLAPGTNVRIQPPANVRSIDRRYHYGHRNQRNYGKQRGYGRHANRYYGGHGRRHTGRHHVNRDRIHLDRQRQIARYNENLRHERQLQSRSGVRYERSYPGVYGGALIISINPGNSGNGGAAAERVDVGQECPQYHNCGQRLYTDNTGPRLILLEPEDQTYRTSEDPRIITFEEIN